MTTDRLLVRSTLSFAALPGLVAYVIPLLLLRPPSVTLRLPGIVVAAFGTAVLIACVRAFHVRGRGTLAPWDPPQTLVRTGLYRYSRNPMYVGVIMVLAGWGLAWPSARLWVYAAATAVAFHIRVLVAEEPWLAASFGNDWIAYKRSVPRWFGRVR